jgi:hypothetical protein
VQFLLCKKLKSTTIGKDIFDVVNNFFEKFGLLWNYCCGACTNGAPSMIGKYKGFFTLAKIKNPAMIITPCLIHREALVAKTLGEKMLKAINYVITIVNYIKSRPLKTKIFETIYKKMSLDHVHLLLNTEVR